MTMTMPTDAPVIARMRAIVDTIASDLGLDIYDIEQRGATLRITLDTPAGSPSGVTLDQITLATRLINRELDHDDPVPGRYTLEVSSPGLERTLRTPAHFQREVGKVVSVRVSGVEADQRRVTGTLVAADDTTATIQPSDQPDEVRVIPIHSIDRARTVFEWGPQPKPGKARSKKSAKNADATRSTTRSTASKSTASKSTRRSTGKRSQAIQPDPADDAGNHPDKETT